MEFKNLISKCIQKDRKAQESLYKMLHGKMLGLCLRYFKNRDDALNVLNQGFLKVFNNLYVFDEKYDFEGWAYRIIQNTALDQLKSMSRRLKWEEASDEDYSISVEPTSLTNLYAQDVMELIQKLPETTAMVFNLHVIDGYSHKDIASLLGISIGTSKWHMHQAKLRLKAMILKLQPTAL